MHRVGVGPPVIVLHELFGMTEMYLSFCYRLAADGFTVWMPQLVGSFPSRSRVQQAAAVGAICISREIDVLRSGRRSPVVTPLPVPSRVRRALSASGVLLAARDLRPPRGPPPRPTSTTSTRCAGPWRTGWPRTARCSGRRGRCRASASPPRSTPASGTSCATTSSAWSARVRLLWTDPDFWGDDDTPAVYVHGLMVDRRAAGHGLGTALLDWAAARGRDAGVDLFRLDCRTTNPVLRAYYERYGFRAVGQRDFADFSCTLLERVWVGLRRLGP